MAALAITGCDIESGVKTGDRALIESTKGRLRKLAVALDQWRIQKGDYPATLEDLLDEQLIDSRHYLADHWDGEILYEITGENGFVLLSMGPDGEEGTEDDIEFSRDR